MNFIDIIFLTINSGMLIVCGWLAVQGIREGRQDKDIVLPICASTPLVCNIAIVALILNIITNS